MFCRNCGAEIPENVLFCPNCGAAVPIARPASPAATPAPSSPAPQQTAQAIAGQTPPAPQQTAQTVPAQPPLSPQQGPSGPAGAPSPEQRPEQTVIPPLPPQTGTQYSGQYRQGQYRSAGSYAAEVRPAASGAVDSYDGMATASVILGIIGIIGGWIPVISILAGVFALIATILGAVARKHQSDAGIPTGTATSGMVMGIIGLVLSFAALVACVACASCLGSMESPYIYN